MLIDSREAIAESIMGLFLDFFTIQIIWIVFERCIFNSRTAIAGATIGLLLVFSNFVVMIFLRTYDVTTCFLFILSCNFNWSACVTSILCLVEQVFCAFAWLNFWSHLAYLTLKNDFLDLKLTFNYFNSKR